MTDSLEIQSDVPEFSLTPEFFHGGQEPPSCSSTAHSPDALDIGSLIKEIVAESSDEGVQMRELGVMFRDLRAVGLGVGAAVQRNLASLFHPHAIIRYVDAMRRPPVRDIISGFDGVVLPGEMLLVLGRPGAGCSTFLRILANHREDYHDVLGDVLYNSYTSGEIRKRYRGDVIYSPEDDVHFPTLKVQETLEFASTMRAPGCREDDRSRMTYAKHMAEVLMRIFGLQHARDTIVGDASLRGISGGEKKRVSIAEVMSARGRLVCWDNPTRGLDSSTALEFIRALRVVTDIAKTTTIASVYQCGEQLFGHFDKVCVIHDGKMAYFGPAKDVKRYFMDMGYEPQNRQTTPDFLVASTDPNGRRIRAGFRGIIPRTADEMATHFKASAYGELNRSSMGSYRSLYVDKPDLRKAYDTSATNEQARYALNSQSYTLSIPMQIRALICRRWRILKGEWVTQAVLVGAQIFQAIFIGTVFFKLGGNTSAYFPRGSLLYFALFCGSTLSIAEIPGLFPQRLVVLRHQKGALYFPFIDALAYIVVDVPITFVSITAMAAILYSLVGLQKTAEQFFTFLLFIFTVTLVIKTCFRCVAAFSARESTALSLAGMVFLILVLYTGYAIPKGNIVRWLRWITYLDPLRYAFESLIVNEFHTINGTCTTLVPSGPGYENVTLAHQVCTTVGSQPGMKTVPGNAYTYLSFGYSYSNLWKNLGILWIFGLAVLVALLFFVQDNKRTTGYTTVTFYRKESKPSLTRGSTDEESVTQGDLCEKRGEPGAANNAGANTDDHISEGDEQADTFSWNNIDYEIPVSGGEMRKLLDDVSGYVAPRKLTALMGESGAGKTVLLNVLAQRTSIGVVHGDCLVNGCPLPADFRAQAAYVQQMDTHIPESTVREALLFSARLRQPATVPMAEKEAYVDKCLKMCGLESHADAIVGSLGLEHKKRVTIGVELAAKPKLLLFLDEPTSGLDSQSAWAIVMFLRELANNGQAILCSIHQPSGELFQLFDRLLLLRKGGQTVYFGDIGERSMTMIEYFQRNGAPRCAPDANPAEYMLDVIGAGATATCKVDWHQIWRESPEAAKVELKIDHIHEEAWSRPVASAATHPEFASSWMKQLALLTHRGLVCCWRNPMYIYSKLIVFAFAGILIGFTFFGATNSVQGCQDKLFSIFIGSAVSLPITLHLQGRFIDCRTVYEVRERASGMFSLSAFLLSQVLIELPWNILGSSLFFFCWYWSSGFDSSRVGLSYLFFSVVFPLYYTTLMQAVAAISPNGTIAAALSCAIFSVTTIFAGVVQTYSQLGRWKWMYYLSPFMYIVDGLLGQALGKQLITCAPIEFVTINPPSGMSCGTYMNPYISFAGGYLVDPESDANCAYCPFRTTDAWMQSEFNVSYTHRWMDLGVIIGFAAFNTLCMFVGMYFLRLHKGMRSPLASLKHSSTKNK